MSQSFCWLVESRIGGGCEGWLVMTPESDGGWLTQDANRATKFSEDAAKQVAATMNYFGVPFRWSRWEALEHGFADISE